MNSSPRRQRTCIACGQSIFVDARFCTHCGIPADQPMQGTPDGAETRRLAERAINDLATGLALLRGDGTPVDKVGAAQYLEKAAVLSPEASFILAGMYHEGDGVPVDSQRAVSFYMKAASEGYVAAYFNLGLMFAKGSGVPQDLEKARVLYERAGSLGHVKSQFNLGKMLLDGRLGYVDAAQAYAWLKLASLGGHVKATDAYHYLASDFSAEEIQQGEAALTAIQDYMQTTTPEL